jgi:hypothetical protein
MSKADYIEKLKRFHAQHGRAPTATTINPSTHA